MKIAIGFRPKLLDVLKDYTHADSNEALHERLRKPNTHLTLDGPHTQSLLVMKKAKVPEILELQDVCANIALALAGPPEIPGLPTTSLIVQLLQQTKPGITKYGTLCGF